MTADTDTIREALELVPKTRTQNPLGPWRNDPAVDAALAALGRVEERERALTEALRFYAEEAIWDEHGAAFRFGDGLPDRGRAARAALAASVAGEQAALTEPDGVSRAPVGSMSPEPLLPNPVAPTPSHVRESGSVSAGSVNAGSGD